ncbi:hypothetical protein M5689_000067 [Euphorbia peplus]|nr:hypothetical protein M5689_000067 [Euphorbia peplus]
MFRRLNAFLNGREKEASEYVTLLKKKSKNSMRTLSCPTIIMDVGTPVIMAMVFFLSTFIIIPFIAAVLSAYHNRNDVHNIDLEQAESEVQNNSESGLREPLIQGLSSKPPILHGLIPIPSKPLTSSPSLTPTLISIGPSHFSAADKLPLDQLKQDYLRHCLQRLPQNKDQSDFEAKMMKCITEFIRENKESICQCYEGYHSKCKDGYDKDFEANVMEDSFFVFELFLRERYPSKYRNDQLLSHRRHRIGVQQDLVLMTNQLPYFFLRDLYSFVFDSAARYPSFDSLAQNYIGKLPLITGNGEGLVDSCCSGFSHCVEDFFRSLFYCFWTRHLTTFCNSRDSDGDDVAISTTYDPIFQFTNLFRDRVVNGNTLNQGSTLSSSTRNRPESSSSSPAGMIGVNSSAGPSSFASRGQGPIHEGSNLSSSTGITPLHEESSSSSPAGMVGLNSSPGLSSSASRGEGPIHEGSTPSSSTGNGPPREASSSSSSAGMIGVNSSSGPSFSSTRNITTVVHSARKQQEVGVKLKASDDGCMINIKYENGILSIPPLELYDYTERTLRNLIAFEQRAYPEQAYISCYIKFMEYLVKSEDEADLLIHKDIIVNAQMAGGGKEVKELLQRLCKDIVLPTDFYPKVCQLLITHRDNWWYRNVAEFVNKYFDRPIQRIVILCASAAFFVVIFKFISPYVGIAPPLSIPSG